MSAEEKKREDVLWTEFAVSGQLPISAANLLEERGGDYVKQLLSGNYNNLTKFIVAEPLIAHEGAVAPYIGQQVDAARWVQNLVFSKTRNYERKTEMAAAVIAFMTASANPLLNKIANLTKAREQLRAKSQANADSVNLAKHCLSRLIATRNDDPSSATMKEFQELTISVTWEFVRHNLADLAKQSFGLLPSSPTGNQFVDDQIPKLSSRVEGLVLQPIREWTLMAKELHHTSPEPLERIRSSFHKLAGHAELIPMVRQDAKLREIMLMWISLFMGKLKKSASGIGPELGCRLVQILRADGLRDLPAPCWERKVLDPPPEKGDGVLPATIEKLANGLYSIVKTWKMSEHAAGAETIEWVIGILEQVYSRLPDEKWGDFRIGKLLMVIGRIDDARKKVIPTVRRNQTQFWAWDALGKLFPEHQRACIAKAMLCPADEQMKVKVKKFAIELYLPIDDESAMRREADGVLDLLLEGIEPVRGILESRYRNKEGRDRVRFWLENNQDVRPVSPGAVRLPPKLSPGSPLAIFLDETDPSRVIAVRRREGAPWDLLPQAEATFYGRSKKGNAMLAADSFETTCPMDMFPQLHNAKIGEAVIIHYTKRTRDFSGEKNVTVYDVKSLTLTGSQSNLLFAFEGPLRMPNDLNGPLFVNGIFIPRDLIDRLLDRGVAEGVIMGGTAVKLPPRMTSDRFGHRKSQSRSHAITLNILGGEALERYRMANR